MEKLKSENLIDYFFVCGLDYNVGLDTYELTSESEDYGLLLCMPPLERPYKATILQRFPEQCGAYAFPEDYSITSLSMPDGLRLYTSSTVSAAPINHNFIVIREDYSRIYGTSLLFAEEIDNDDIKLAVIDLQNMYRINHNTIDGRHSYCSECNNLSPDTPNCSTRDSGWFSCSNTSLSGVSMFYGSENEKLYTMKAIGVLSQEPYIQCLQSWLYDIWLMVSNKLKIIRQPSVESSSDVDLDTNDIQLEIDSKINLESYIYNILFEIDAPKRGETIVIQGPLMKHFCHCPDSQELPVFELPMRDLLEVLGLESLIRIYSCVLLEYRVVILSQDYRLLMLVAECITCLLFPFVWSHVYAPILPLAARHFLNAPVPFIMGIKLNHNDDEEDIQLPSDASVCYVNIDKQTVKSSDDIPSFPYEMDLRREITDLLVNSINNGSIPPRPIGGRRTSYTSRSPSNSDSKMDQPLKNRSNLPPKKHIKSSDLSKNINEHEVPLDVLIDNPQVAENLKQGSQTSSIIDSKLFFNNYRLPSDPGSSVYDTYRSFINSDGSIKSDQLANIYYNMLNFNAVLRELFLNHFLHIFYDYEQFIISPKAELNTSTYLMDRELTVQAFDKAGFLSEQPETHLPFLSAFLETQMFAQFIDMKMIANWEDPHPNLVLFERKLRTMHSKNVKYSETQNLNEMDFRLYRNYINLSQKLQDPENLLKAYVKKMNKLEPKIVPHVLTCNNPDNRVCQPQKRSQFCFKHHHHHNIDVDSINSSEVCLLGTNFPILQGDCLRNKPRKKSSIKNLDNKILNNKVQREINDLEKKIKEKSVPLNDCSDHSLSSYKHYTTSHTGELNAQKETRIKLDPKPYLPNIIPAGMAQNHWTFVNTLLQECKAKTKRMVLEKMGGQEAIELGHGDLFVSDIEENTLVAGLCDLLERIWCHGLTNKHGKSALWTHLIKYVERDKQKCIVKRTNKEKLRRSSGTAIKSPPSTELVKDALTGVGIDSYCLFRYFNDSKGDLHHGDVFGSLKQMKMNSASLYAERSKTPEFLPKPLLGSGSGVSELFFNWNQNSSGSLGRNRALSSNSGSTKNIDLESIFGPKRRSLVADINAIKLMKDIKTDVGLARAFVRLALEKKLLSEHLKKLLLDTNLLRELYKRHAFLRCEEEREQFLFHLLALQAVEYYSFTNLYIKSQLVYRVFIYSAKKFSTGTSTTANAWFCVNGQHCSTGQRSIPKNLYQFEFENQNLGVLTTLGIGHDNSGLSPKWFIEFVLIQNLITGQVYRFPCNNWLGKGVDDSSTERLLVGELIRINEDEIKNDQQSGSVSILGFQTPPRSRSPSVSRRQSDGNILSEVPLIQEQLGNAVNNLVKYFFRQQERDKMIGNNIGGSCNVTFLLCGAKGLVPSMEKVFRFGFKSSRLFQRKFYVWDYLEKVANEFTSDLDTSGKFINDLENKKYSNEDFIAIRHFCRLITRISNVNQSIGKDGKFQRFVCLGIRDHMLPHWIGLFGNVDCTEQYFDESCFFRDTQLREFLIKILSSLNDFVIPLERALTDGL